MFQEKVASSSQTTAQALFIITTNRLRHEAKGGLHTSHSMKQIEKREKNDTSFPDFFYM